MEYIIRNRFNDTPYSGSSQLVFDYDFYKVTKELNSISLRYFAADDISPLWFNDFETYQVFPKKYKVDSGKWYKKEGIWRTLKRVGRETKCSNISNYNETAGSGNNKFYINKVKFSNKLNVLVESDKFPTIKFKCSDISLTDFYQLMLFDLQTQQFVDCTYLFEGKVNFIGKMLDLAV
jgi:hypothetical protein